MRLPSLVAASILFTGLAAAQTTLPDETSVVATRQGVFLVLPGQPAQLLLAPGAFGHTELVGPSVTWIRETDLFLVTSRIGGGGSAGLWRMHVTPGGAASLEDLAASAPPEAGFDFADADYSMGLDTAFILNTKDGRLLALKDPAHSSGAQLGVWATVPPGEATAIAVNGARWPFGIVMAMRVGDSILRRTKSGTEVLFKAGTFDQVTANPVTGQWFLMSKTTGLIGLVSNPDSQFAIDFNAYGPCFAIVSHPEDVDWNPVQRRLVALGGGGINCGFGGLATGDNHIVRLPEAALGGSPPVLLTFLGDSGIAGTQGDLAIVFAHGCDVTFVGSPGTAGDGSRPEFASGSYATSLQLGEPSVLGLQHGVPGAMGFLIVGLQPLFVAVQGQVLGPDPALLLPVAVDAAGNAAVNLTTPANSSLLGLRVYAQWWLDDISTPGAGDFVSSHAAILTVGVP